MPESKPVSVRIKAISRDVLSKEQHLYLHHIEMAIKKNAMGQDPEAKFLKTALQSLAHDEGLSQMVPFFVQFVVETVKANLGNLPLLFNLMKMTRALLQNPHIRIEHYVF